MMGLDNDLTDYIFTKKTIKRFKTKKTGEGDDFVI